LTSLQVAALLVETGQRFSSLTSLAVHYPQVLLNVPVRERRPLEKIPHFNKTLADVNAALGDTGRTLVRYSGTEPLLRIMVEGPDRSVIQAHAESLAGVVQGRG
jgi:phosphoglucosamine mutase